MFSIKWECDSSVSWASAIFILQETCTRNLHQNFEASFLYKVLVRLSPALHRYKQASFGRWVHDLLKVRSRKVHGLTQTLNTESYKYFTHEVDTYLFISEELSTAVIVVAILTKHLLERSLPTVDYIRNLSISVDMFRANYSNTERLHSANSDISCLPIDLQRSRFSALA